MPPLIPGEATPVVPGVWRVLALNPGMMTGPGTNTYLIGKHSLTVLDPGPADERHTENLLLAADRIGLPITQVLVTHTHRDHSPGAQALAAQLPVQCIGPQIAKDSLQDSLWVPGIEVTDNGHVDAGGLMLRAIATPGHVDNHFCYLLESEGLLFSGDHLIHGSTVVIAPPSGSMRAYMQSLARIARESLKLMAPGHGELIEEPMAYVEKNIAHRHKREDKVHSALSKSSEPVTPYELVPAVYDDVPTFLHGVAALSLQAHLIKLEEDNLAERATEGRWQSKPGN